MKVSGITIAYQAESNGYPVAESIRSMLPLCDEVIVNIGQSDDGTRRAVRVVRRDPAIRSVGDALKFRRFTGSPPRPRRLRVLRTNVTVYHYGWARPPDVMLRKQRHFERFWHGDEALREKYAALSAE